MDLKQLINDFTKLSLKDKKTKLKNIIKTGNLDQSSPIFASLLEKLNTSKVVDDEIYINIYTDIMALGQEIWKNNDNKKKTTDGQNSQ